MAPRKSRTTRRAGWRSPLCFLLALCGLWVLAATALAGPPSGSQPTVQISQCPSGQTNDPSCQQSSASLQTATPPSSSKSGSSQTASAPASPPSGSEVHTYSLSNGHGSVTTAAGTHLTDKAQVQVAPSSAPSTPAPGKPKPKPPTMPGVAPALPHPQPVVSTTGGNPVAGYGSAFSSLSLISTDQALSQFQVPPFLMPIYLAAARAYDVPWPVLAAINKIESDFGRDLSVSSAGALGWMQFMPDVWKAYGVDANGDGYADPYNPADAIFAAARYLHDAGASSDLHQAIFAYNHANWYVDEVLQAASVYGSLPPGVVTETGSLAFGRFPLQGPVSYGDVAASSLSGSAAPALKIRGQRAATAVATQQVKVTRILLDSSLARELSSRGFLASAPGTTPAPASSDQMGLIARIVGVLVPVPSVDWHATFQRPRSGADRTGGLPRGFGIDHVPGITVVVRDPAGNQYSYGGLSVLSGSVRPGAILAGGQAVGTLPGTAGATLDFSITAAGGVPVDPRPLIDGYRLQEAAHFYHAVAPFGANPFVPAAPTASYAGYVSPFAGYTPTAERIDMGVDYSAPPGSPLVAIGPGRVIGIDPSWYAGQPFVDYQITSGPLTGVYVYYAEQITPAVSPGQSITAGQVIGRVASSGTGLELGFGTPVPGQTLAVVSGGYSEGELTAAGQAYSNLMLTLGAPAGLAEGRSEVGNVTGALPSLSGIKVDPAPHMSAAPATPATQQQEQTISRALDQISNPKVLAPSPDAIRVPKGQGANPPGVHSPLTTIPSSAGADVQALAAPSGGSGLGAWAIGTVDGTLRNGWAKSQTVLLRFDQGAWSLVGPPVNQDGHAVNPHLRALAVTSDGSGYAVGDKGAVVRFGPGHAPQLIQADTAGNLAAVAVDAAGSQLHGVAVGARGTVVALRGSDSQKVSSPSGHPDLTAVSIDRSGAVTAGNGSTGPVVYRVSGGQLSPVSLHLKLPAGAQAQVTGLADSGGQLWLSGGLSDSSGLGTEAPLAVRQTGTGTQTFCASGPQAAGATELGTPTPSECDGSLPAGTGGPATAVALTRKAAVLATGDGLLVSTPSGAAFHPAARSSGPDQAVTATALAADGSGWAVVGGRLAMLLSAPNHAASAGTVRPLPGHGTATITAPLPSGTGAVITGTGGAAVLGAGTSQGIRAPGVALRSLALPQAGSGWGISETGGLVRYSGGSWSDANGGALPADLTRRLGGQPLASNQLPLTVGLNSVSFASPQDGYAVGGQGLILHYQGGAWHQEQSGTGETLSDVVDSSSGAVAVGSHGVLLERGGDGWSSSDQAASLVGGHDFSQVAAAADGTVVALAGGSMIVRKPGQSDWAAAPLAPLASAPTRLVVYRAGSGELHAVALVSSAGGQALVDGDTSGWRPLDVPAGLQPSDVGVDPTGTRMWLAGQSAGHPAGAELALSDQQIPANLIPQGGASAQAVPTPAPADASTDQSSSDSGIASLVRLMR